MSVRKSPAQGRGGRRRKGPSKKALESMSPAMYLEETQLTKGIDHLLRQLVATGTVTRHTFSNEAGHRAGQEMGMGDGENIEEGELDEQEDQYYDDNEGGGAPPAEGGNGDDSDRDDMEKTHSVFRQMQQKKAPGHRNPNQASQPLGVLAQTSDGDVLVDYSQIYDYLADELESFAKEELGIPVPQQSVRIPFSESAKEREAASGKARRGRAQTSMDAPKFNTGHGSTGRAKTSYMKSPNKHNNNSGSKPHSLRSTSTSPSGTRVRITADGQLKASKQGGAHLAPLHT